MWHINRVHRSIRQTEYLATLKSHNEAWQLLLAGWHFSRLDVEGIIRGKGEHIVHLKVPRCRNDISLLEKKRMRLDIIDKHGLMLVNYRDFRLIS